MIKIEFIHTEIHYSVGNYKESEDIVVRPEQRFGCRVVIRNAAWLQSIQEYSYH